MKSLVRIAAVVLVLGFAGPASSLVVALSNDDGWAKSRESASTCGDVSG